MRDSNVVSSLTYKYARLKGEAEQHEQASKELRDSLVHIEHVIRLYRDDWEPHFVDAVRPRIAGPWRYSQTGIRTAFEVLKRAERPLTAKEIAVRAVQLVDEPTPDKKRITAIASGVSTSLARHIGTYVEKHEGRPARWSMLTQPVANTLPICG